jgi:hypothetical protein
MLIAAALLLGAALVLGPDANREEGTEMRPARPAPSAPASGGRRVQARVDGAARSPAVVRARVGDLLSLRVTAPEPDEVELAGLGRFDAADAFSPARFEFFVARPGQFPIRLRQARRVVGRLVFARR